MARAEYRFRYDLRYKSVIRLKDIRPLSCTQSVSIPLCVFHDWHWCSQSSSASSWLVAGPSAQRPRFDVVIANGRIVDGTGSPWFRGDVGIVGDRIAAIGALATPPPAVRIDATNLVVAPGFIDLLGQSEFNVLVDGRAASKILQGVTTEVTGEGSSIAPVNDRLIAEASANARHFGVVQDWRTLADYFRRLEERSHPTINVATFVGAGGIRNYVIGKDDRPGDAGRARADEAAGRARRCSRARWASARRCSTCPDRFASTDEIVELAKVAARYGGVYFTHQRSESARIFESLDEVFADRRARAAFRRRSGISRPRTRRTSARCRRCCGASRRRVRAAST